MNFEVPIEYKYIVHPHIMMNAKNELQCFCMKPLTRSGPQARQCSCKTCGFTVNIESVKRLHACDAFAQWPKLKIPICKACRKTSMMLTKNKTNEKTMKLSFSCECKPRANWFSVDDQNAECWEGFVNEIASNVPATENNEPVFILKPAF